MSKWKEKAKHFLEKEPQFHLGKLPSEMSNQKTRGLDSTFKKSLQDGVRQLQSVDCDLIQMAEKAFSSGEFSGLVDSIVNAIMPIRGLLFPVVAHPADSALCLKHVGENFGSVSKLIILNYMRNSAILKIRFSAL